MTNTNIKDRKVGRDLLSFLKNVQRKNIILFGAGSVGKRTVLSLLEKGLKKRQMLFCDNNPVKWGKEIIGIRVLSLPELKKKPKTVPVVVASAMFKKIIEQLHSLNFSNVYYIHSLLWAEHLFSKYDDEFLKLVDDMGERCDMDNDEKYTLYSSMEAVSNLQGEVAEVGVYKGGSAKILCERKKNKEIHLFDTFEGIPEEVVAREDLVGAGWLSDVDVTEVKKYLSIYPNVVIHKGTFPWSADSVKHKKFCLVNLDTDIYQGTFEGLKFFWPRMVKGGRVICHDYNNVDCPGVKRAFMDYFKNNPEKIIDIASTQSMVVK